LIDFDFKPDVMLMNMLRFADRIQLERWDSWSHPIMHVACTSCCWCCVISCLTLPETVLLLSRLLELMSVHVSTELDNSANKDILCCLNNGGKSPSPSCTISGHYWSGRNGVFPLPGFWRMLSPFKAPPRPVEWVGGSRSLVVDGARRSHSSVGDNKQLTTGICIY
jgi:hypothetical protein